MKIKIISALMVSVLLISCNIPHPNGVIETSGGNSQPVIDSITPDLTNLSTISAVSISTMTYSSAEAPSLTPTTTQDLTATVEPGVGGITGNIYGYPYGSIPKLVIVAYAQMPPFNYWFEILTPESTFYSMIAGDEFYVSSGRYLVVAYDPLGNTGGCITIVVVKPDEIVTCDISDWDGGYPPKPSDVP